MFTRANSSSRIAHGSDSSSEGTPSPPRATSQLSSPSQKPLFFPVRRKFQLHLLRLLRISSFFRLLKRLSKSCHQALHSFMMPSKKKKPSKGSGKSKNYEIPNRAQVGTGLAAYCTSNACAPDAIADCIEFIKRSAASSSQPSSPLQSANCQTPPHSQASPFLLSPS